MATEVFITDGHWRKSLAAVRALGRQGVTVDVGESTRLATALFSKYCRRKVVYPSPLRHPENFGAFLRKRLSRGDYRMILPMEDETTALVARHREEWSRWAYIPTVSLDRLNTARQKDKILKMAEGLGIPIPRTWYVDDLAALEAMKATMTFPVVIKPRTASGALGVRYPAHWDDFVRQYNAVHKHFPFPLVQELIPREGKGYGASFLFDAQGTVKASFIHKRLREYPVNGGASTLRESAVYDDIREMGQSLLKALNWFGVAMVEFKLDPRDGIPKLMEINPRFWGSLPLAIAAGVNFPYLLYRLSRGENFKPVDQYRIGQRCRWLLPGDLLHFIYHPHRRRLLPGFFNFWDQNTSYDILSRDDPLPVMGRILTPLTFLYDPDIKQRLKMRKI